MNPSDLRELGAGLLKSARASADPNVARNLREDARVVLADGRAATFRHYASEVGRRNATLTGYREYLRAQRATTTNTSEQTDETLKESST